MATTSHTPEPTPADAATGLRSNALATSMRRALCRYVRLLGADAGLADDMVQEAFLIALRRPDFDARVPGAAFTFLRTTARNLWLRRHGARQDRQWLTDADTVWDARCADGGEDYVEALRSCLDRLPERSRSLLTVTYQSKASRAAASAAFGIGEQGIKSALRRLRSFLHDCIARRLREEAP